MANIRAQTFTLYSEPEFFLVCVPPGQRIHLGNQQAAPEYRVASYLHVLSQSMIGKNIPALMPGDILLKVLH